MKDEEGIITCSSDIIPACSDNEGEGEAIIIPSCFVTKTEEVTRSSDIIPACSRVKKKKKEEEDKKEKAEKEAKLGKQEVDDDDFFADMM